MDLLDRRLLFVTGKGGVGKSTIAAGLALLAAQRGRRTLLCELDAKGSLAEFFEARPTGFSPREVQPGLFLMTMDTEASLQEYLSLQLRLPFAARIGPLARVLEFVATAAPGAKEILTVGKLAWEVRERRWDLVVADAAASGHVVSQLGAPEAVRALVHVGPVRHQTGWVGELLADPAVSGVCIVATPEEMPVIETVELAARIRAETDVDLAAIVVNRVLPELFGRGEEAVFEHLREPGITEELARAVRVDPASVATVAEGARLAVTMRRTRTAHLERLRAGVEPAVPMLYVPELFSRAHGLRATHQVAEALSAELGY